GGLPSATASCRTFKGDGSMHRIFENEDSLRREIVTLGKRLYRLGFTPGTSGNLSARLDSRFLLATPTGVSKSMLRQEDMVIVDLDGHQYAGTRKVTSEIGMHLAVYRQR